MRSRLGPPHDGARRKGLSGHLTLPALSCFHLGDWPLFSILLPACCCSGAQLCPTLCNPMDSSTPDLLSFTNSWSPPKPMSIEPVMPSNHLILCRPLLLPPSIFPSIRVFSNESALCIRWPKYWSFSFNISPSNEYSGLSSFRMDLLDLLAVPGILPRVFSNTTVQKHQCFVAQLSLESNAHICTSEKAMAPHSSTLAWKIPWTEEPGRLQSMGLLGVGHD